MAITVKNLSGVRAANVTLATDLSTRLKEDILTGKLKKNQKLTEAAICEEYRVSRTPVREALVALEAEGLIETIPNRGAFVLGLSEQDKKDIYILRGIYEVQATRWAIERITEEEMEALSENFDFMEFYTMKKDVEKMLNINVNFHRMIYRASHNRLLQNLLSSYQIYVKHINKPNPASPKDKYLNDVLDEHRAIFRAFVEKDPEAGAKAMEIHMKNSQERFT